jgi:predicted small lipoprotein YifL
MLIIAIFLLSLSACGYKAPPYYMQEAEIEDENVEFILKENPPEQKSCDDDKNRSSEN